MVEIKELEELVKKLKEMQAKGTDEFTKFYKDTLTKHIDDVIDSVLGFVGDLAKKEEISLMEAIRLCDEIMIEFVVAILTSCLLYTSPSPRD